MYWATVLHTTCQSCLVHAALALPICDMHLPIRRMWFLARGQRIESLFVPVPTFPGFELCFR